MKKKNEFSQKLIQMLQENLTLIMEDIINNIMLSLMMVMYKDFLIQNGK